MKYEVIDTFQVKLLKDGKIIEFKSGQILNLPHEKAQELVGSHKIRVADVLEVKPEPVNPNLCEICGAREWERLVWSLLKKPRSGWAKACLKCEPFEPCQG